MNMISFMQNWGPLIVAVASLVVAVVSLVKSSNTQRLQNRLNELEYKIKATELERIEKEKLTADYSCVEARVINISKGSYKLKVWNSGNVKVFNVNAFFNEGAEIIVPDDKMPFEELEPGKGFEQALIIHMGSARKFKITTTWADTNGKEFSKTQMGDR